MEIKTSGGGYGVLYNSNKFKQGKNNFRTSIVIIKYLIIKIYNFSY